MISVKISQYKKTVNIVDSFQKNFIFHKLKKIYLQQIMLKNMNEEIMFIFFKSFQFELALMALFDPMPNNDINHGTYIRQ